MRYAPDETPLDETLDVSRLAHKFDELPEINAASGPTEARAFVDGFLAVTKERGTEGPQGGDIQPATAEEHALEAATEA
jgi:hypothetical protein